MSSEKSAKKVKKVLDKRKQLWYDNWALKKSEGDSEGLKSPEEKISKKFKKALDKSKRLWYNHKALLREGNEPWKLNNDKNETLED